MAGDGDTTMPSSAEPSSATIGDHSHKDSVQNSKYKRDSAVSLLTAVNSKNIIDITGNTKEQTSSAAPSTRLLRTRTTMQSKLAYDLKYHPMDDSLRPTQAAKRRTAHGEELLFADDTSDASSFPADTDAESVAHVEDSEDESERRAKSTLNKKKRSRARSQSPQPTRRSSRRTEDRKMSYRMDIHPQDKLLEVSSDDSDDEKHHESDDGEEDESQAPMMKRAKLNHTLPSMGDAASHDGENMHTLEQHPGVAVDRVSKDPVFSVDDFGTVLVDTSSPSSSVATPPSHAVRCKEGLDVWKLTPGERCFRHERDAWPSTPGLSFEIYSERLEDQLAAEAKAASPLNFEDDDKENDITTDADLGASATASAAVMPASQYRRTSGENQALRQGSMVERALYDDIDTSSSPYGLGSDGTLDGMSVLASGEQLPRSPVCDQVLADEIECVIGLFS